MQNQLNKAWESFVGGNTESLQYIFMAYHKAMLFKAYYYIKDTQGSLDIVSDCFERLIAMSEADRKHRLSHVEPKLEAYLLAMVKYRCLDVLKVEKNRSRILKHLNFSTYYQGSTKNDPNFDSDVLILLEQLPEKQQEVLSLHLAGFANEEIAEKTGTSYNTVRNQLSSSKKIMRINLKFLLD